MKNSIESIIDNYFGKIEISKNSVSNYKMLLKLCKEIKEELELELCIDLVNKNNKLYDCLSNIVSDKKILSQVMDSDIELAINFIMAYTTIEDINIYDVEFEDFDYDINYSKTDFVKQYLEEINRYKLLSKEEEQDLFVKYKNGDETARNIITESNLRLVVSVAKRFLNRGLDFLDLIQEGNIGLMKAIDKFEIDKDYKFSTYATYWIRQTISRAVSDKGRGIRIPVHMYEKYKKLNEFLEKYRNIYQHDPSYEEIAEELGISKETARLLYEQMGEIVSLNEKVKDSEGDELEIFIADESDTPEDTVINNMYREDFVRVINQSSLNYREKRVILLRFGFIDGKIWILEDIGKIYGTTRERVRQIEARALRKLRPYFKDGNINTTKLRKVPNKKNAYEIFNICDITILENAMAKLELTFKDKELMALVFGKSYKNFLNIMNIAEADRPYVLNYLIPTIQQFIFEEQKQEENNKLEARKKALEISKAKMQEALKAIEEDKTNINEEKIEIALLADKEEDMNMEKEGINLVEESSKKRRSLKSLYKIFDLFNRDLVDQEVENLNEQDKKIFLMGFGNDYDNPVRSDEWFLNEKENHSRLYSIIIPKMKRNLIRQIEASANGKRIKSKNKVVRVKKIKEEKIVEGPSKKLDVDLYSQKNNMEVESNLTDVEKLYLVSKLKELNYDVLRKYVTEEEAIIISLSLGIDRKKFHIKDIAGLFNITENEVIEITKKVLNILKLIINKTIDDSVDYLLSSAAENYVKKLVLTNEEI